MPLKWGTYDHWGVCCKECGKRTLYFFNKRGIRVDGEEEARFYKCYNCGDSGKIERQLTMDKFISEEK